MLPFQNPQFLKISESCTLSWWEFGDPQGTPVFFFHGWPASGGQGLLFDAAAKKRKLRLISIDRPGFGQSSRQKNRSFIDILPLMGALIQRLQIKQFYLFGLSGGGPYALACARAWPEKVLSTLICCGAPPLDEPGARKHFLLFYRILLRLNDWSTNFLYAVLFLVVNLARIRPPWFLMRRLLHVLEPVDKKALDNKQRFNLFYPSFLASMQAGTGAIFDDGECYTQRWTFQVEEIQGPVKIWHGTLDRNFHYSLAQKLAARIPNATFTTREEGHYSLPTFRIEEMLDDMLDIHSVGSRSSAY